MKKVARRTDLVEFVSNCCQFVMTNWANSQARFFLSCFARETLWLLTNLFTQDELSVCAVIFKADIPMLAANEDGTELLTHVTPVFHFLRLALSVVDDNQLLDLALAATSNCVFNSKTLSKLMAEHTQMIDSVALVLQNSKELHKSFFVDAGDAVITCLKFWTPRDQDVSKLVTIGRVLTKTERLEVYGLAILTKCVEYSDLAAKMVSKSGIMSDCRRLLVEDAWLQEQAIDLIGSLTAT